MFDDAEETLPNGFGLREATIPQLQAAMGSGRLSSAALVDDSSWMPAAAGVIKRA